MKQENLFGKRVRQNRLLLDLTQEELARRVGCAAITVRRIEAGNLRPSKQIAELLAKALGVPFEEQAEFVRQAREVKPGGAEPSPTPTPQVKREEIGLEDLSGRAIRGYTLGERLGKGGFGVVYRAVQPLVDREVAVKIIVPEYADHPDFIRRFESEAQIVARLEHPHIVPLYDYWREPSVAYLVMRLLRGGSVEERLDNGALPLEEVATLVDQVAAALRTAHRVGVVHRDLKPANILLDEDNNAYLTDFGIAKSQSNWETETQAGAFLGSPAYSSPEQILAEPILPQADIYSLGVLIYELLTGEQPFEGPTPIDLAQQHLNTPTPSLADRRNDLPPALDAVIARATAKDPGERYSDIGDLAIDLRQIATTGRLSGDGTSGEGSYEIKNPYKGLRAFSEADAVDFQGRETLVQQLLARLAEDNDLSRFLAIIGPSGSGKSSVAKAGLMPALRRGALPGSENWFIIDLTPGSHPLEELADALQRVAVNPADDLPMEMRRDAFGLARVLESILPDDNSTELVILIDQFEEVFTHDLGESARTHLLEMLVATVLDERSRARVVITLRADFVDQPLRYTDFGELLKNRSELVLPLTPDEMEHAIRNPAERVGLSIEPELVAAVIGDVTDQPGSLPLMQFALTETFEQRTNGRLTLETYRSLGGVRGALAHRADDVYEGLIATDQEAARQMFLRLVTLGQGVEDTRRRVPRSELAALSQDLDSIVDRFAAYRLLTLDHDPATREPTVEVAHESLLREWPRLSNWIDESRSDIRMQRQLGRAAQEWTDSGADMSFLMRGTRLAQFETWTTETELALTESEHDYLDASTAQRGKDEALEAERAERELRMEKTRRTLTRALLAVLAVGLVAALGLSAFALNQRDDALQSADARATAQVEAEAAQAEAEQETLARAAAQEETEAQRQEALVQASIGLASQAELELQGSFPERGALLALQALENYPYTWQAERALGKAVIANHLKWSLDHEATVNSALWSPDGTLIATASADGTAKIWDARSGELIYSLKHGDLVGDALWSPSGDRILTFSNDGFVRLWSTDSGELRFSLGGHDEDGYVDWSPSGDRFLSTDHDGVITVWDADSGKELVSIPNRRVCSGLLGCSSISAWSPSGDRLLTRSRDEPVLEIWDSATGEALHRLSVHEGQLRSLAWSPDGSMIVSGDANGNVLVWDADSGEMLATLTGHTDVIRSVSWTLQGDRILTASDDSSAKVWSATTGEELVSFDEHNNFVYAGAWSPDGDRVATASIGGAIMLWDALTGELLETFFGHQSEIRSVEWSDSAAQILSASADGSAKVWTVSDQSVLFEISASAAGYWGVTWSPGGDQIARGRDDGTVRVFDVATLEPILLLDGHPGSFTSDIGWSPAGDRIYTIGADSDGMGKIWDSSNGELLATFVHPEGHLWFSSWSPDGTRIVTPSADGNVMIWDTGTGDLLHTFEEHNGFSVIAEWSPDGAHIASGDLVGGLMIWDADSGEILLDLLDEDYGVETTTLSWAPDGSRLAAHSTDGLRIWDSENGELLASSAGHGAYSFDLDWLPSGDRIVTLGAEGNVKVWDSQTGAELLSFKGGPGEADISPDGTSIAVARIPYGPLTVFKVWQSLDELIEYARECCVFRELTPEEREQFGLSPTESR